jgi:hypothetical protein
VEVAGEVVAERPIQSVSLVIDGVSRASFWYGQSASNRQVFSLVHAERETVRLDLTSIEIEAQTDDGSVRRTAFTVAAGLNGVDVPHVEEGTFRDIQSPPLAATLVRLYVETAAIDRDSVLHVVGWSVALSHIESIKIFVGDQLVGTTMPDRPRDDIGGAFPAYANARTSGFKFSTPISEEAAPATIAVEAIDPSGARSRVIVPVDHGAIKASAPSLPDVSATEPAATPRRGKQRTISVHCDETMLIPNGDLFVSGWAVCAVGIAAISVRLDGEVLGNAELGLPRPDVGERYPGVPEASNAGFRLRVCPGTLLGPA